MNETPQVASLCVLASGSAGNCSVLLMESTTGPRIVLIDAGLSPRRTRRLLAGFGLGFEHLEAIILTHLDRDHWHGGWLRALPGGVWIWAHKRHAARGRRSEILPGDVRGFEASFELDVNSGSAPVRISAALASHDELGVAAFRFEFGVQGSSPCAALGFATDVGRMRDHLIEHLRGVDVLAIESNYCPLLQEASARPWFLKRRITGGGGHLSNHEALAAVREIEPRSEVVLLHLSRECNDPQLVASLHDGAPYRCTITSQLEPTDWVHIRPAPREAFRQDGAARTPRAQLPLFGFPGATAPATNGAAGGA